MNKTRFQLPPRTRPAERIEDWMTEESVATAFRWLDDKTPVASGKASDLLASMTFLSMFDMTSLLAAQRRNMEALAAANKIVWEAAQSIGKRNVEIVLQALGGISESMQMSDVPECPGDRAIRQTETAIKAYEDVMTNMRELGETIQHANAEAMEVLGKRFTEAADETKSRARYATRKFWETDAKPAPFWQLT
jgi:phasin family protein